MQEHRCDWCGHDPLYVEYHDTEWGRPDTDSRALFEKLILDGFQAGLSWITILKKRPAFRAGFDNFDPEKIARYGEQDIQRLLADKSAQDRSVQARLRQDLPEVLAPSA